MKIRATDDRRLGITGDIGEEVVARMAEKFSVLMEKDRKAWISLMVNSCGGQTGCGFALYDLFLHFLKPNLQTIALGEVSSIALLPYIAGGERLVTPNTIFFFHEFGATLKKDDRQATKEISSKAEFLKSRQSSYAHLIAEKCQTFSEEALLEIMENGTTLSAKDAVGLGLAHGILR